MVEMNSIEGVSLNVRGAKSADLKIWTTSFIQITLVSLLMRVCTQVQMTSMPLFFVSLGGSNSVAGLSMTFYTIAALALRPAIGSLLDSRGRKPILLWGIVLYTFSTVMYGFVAFISVLILLRVLHGISFSASSTATSTMAADVLPEKKMTEGIAYFGMFGTLAVAVVPGATLYAIEELGYQSLYYWTSIIALAALLLSFGVRNTTPQSGALRSGRADHASAAPFPTDDEVRTKVRSITDRLYERSALQPSIIVFFVALSTSAVAVFLPTYAKQYEIPGIGLFFTVQAVALVLSRFVVGPMSNRKGVSFAVIVNLWLLAASLAGLFLVQSLPGTLVTAALYGFASGCLIPQLNAAAVLRAPAESRGKASATFYMAMDLGIGVGAVLWGIMADGMAVKWVFLGASVLTLAAVIVYVRSTREVQ